MRYVLERLIPCATRWYVQVRLAQILIPFLPKSKRGTPNIKPLLRFRKFLESETLANLSIHLV